MNKKILCVVAAAFSFLIVLPAKAQIDSIPTDSVSMLEMSNDIAQARNRSERNHSRADLSKRASDHLMLQLGYINWSDAQGLEKPANRFNREFNLAFMIDKPFKTNPKISVGFGLGYSAGNVFFNKKDWHLKEALGTDGKIIITDVASQNHFAKYKLVTQYGEIPLELRFSGNAEQPSKGFRVAAGIKFGYLLKSHTKGKDLVQPGTDGGNGPSIYGKDYIVKEREGGNYINNTRFMGTLRFGYGVFNIYGNYQLNTLFKTGVTQGNIRPFTVGIGLGIL